MVKTEYIIMAVVLVLVIAVAGAIAFDKDILAGFNAANAKATPVPADANTGAISRPISALTTLSIVDSDVKVKAWKAQKTNVSVIDISSESCIDGLSTTWTITYVSDGEQALVLFDNGAIINIVKTPLPISARSQPSLATDGLIDSDKASDIAAQTMSGLGKTPIGVVTFELSPGTQNGSVWDVIYRISGGHYLIRLDSSSGNVIESEQYGMG